MKNAFQRWMSSATTKDKARLARLARTTVGSLRQLAGGYRTKGRVRATPEQARRIEIAGRRMGVKFPRQSLCPACNACEFAKRCG